MPYIPGHWLPDICNLYYILLSAHTNAHILLENLPGKSVSESVSVRERTRARQGCLFFPTILSNTLSLTGYSIGKLVGLSQWASIRTYVKVKNGPLILARRPFKLLNWHTLLVNSSSDEINHVP